MTGDRGVFSAETARSSRGPGRRRTRAQALASCARLPAGAFAVSVDEGAASESAGTNHGQRTQSCFAPELKSQPALPNEAG